MINLRFRCRMVLLCTLLLVPLPALALTQFNISSPNADGVFVLTGGNLDGASALDISIFYDPASLNNPRIEFGSLVAGTMSAANPSNPIRIGIVSRTPLRGGGTVATITFDRPLGTPGLITDLKAKLVGNDNRTMTTQAFIYNPVSPSASTVAGGSESTNNDSGSNQKQQSGQGGQTAQSTQTPGGTATAHPVVLGGTVTLPGHEQDGGRGKEASPQTPQQEVTERQAPVREAVAPVPPAGGAETAAEKPAAQPAPPSRIESVLERFRLFQGEKTVGSLAALFKRDGAVSFSQSPAIAIADGKSSVRLAISGVTGDKAPNFTFHAARFVSLSHTGAGEWEVEVTPEAGTVQAGVTMFMNGTQQEFPLTVTPKVALFLTKGAGVGESDFLFFLKERGTASAPKFDLNGDGKRDYLDDYIFTANYLLQMDEKEKQKTAQQPRQ